MDQHLGQDIGMLVTQCSFQHTVPIGVPAWTLGGIVNRKFQHRIFGCKLPCGTLDACIVPLLLGWLRTGRTAGAAYFGGLGCTSRRRWSAGGWNSRSWRLDRWTGCRLLLRLRLGLLPHRSSWNVASGGAWWCLVWALVWLGFCLRIFITRDVFKIKRKWTSDLRIGVSS